MIGRLSPHLPFFADVVHFASQFIVLSHGHSVSQGWWFTAEDVDTAGSRPAPLASRFTNHLHWTLRPLHQRAT